MTEVVASAGFNTLRFVTQSCSAALKYHHIAPRYPFLDPIADLESWLKGEAYSLVRLAQRIIQKMSIFYHPRV